MLTTLINEFVNGDDKVQFWNSEKGYDVITLHKGNITSTYYSTNKKEALNMFDEKVEHISFNASLNL